MQCNGLCLYEENFNWNFKRMCKKVAIGNGNLVFPSLKKYLKKKKTTFFQHFRFWIRIALPLTEKLIKRWSWWNVSEGHFFFHLAFFHLRLEWKLLCQDFGFELGFIAQISLRFFSSQFLWSYIIIREIKLTF